MKHHAQSVKMALTEDLTQKQHTFGSVQHVFLIAHVPTYSTNQIARFMNYYCYGVYVIEFLIRLKN